MTIREIIERVEKKRNNTIDTVDKISWLSELDSKIYEDIIKNHEGYHLYMTTEQDGSLVERVFPYTNDQQMLIAPERFAKMYEYHLMCEIDLAQDEVQRYSNDIMIFNTAYNEFAAWYNETHLPIQAARITTKPNYLRSKENVFPFE